MDRQYRLQLKGQQLRIGCIFSLEIKREKDAKWPDQIFSSIDEMNLYDVGLFIHTHTQRQQPSKQHNNNNGNSVEITEESQSRYELLYIHNYWWMDSRIQDRLPLRIATCTSHRITTTREISEWDINRLDDIFQRISFFFGFGSWVKFVYICQLITLV